MNESVKKKRYYWLKLNEGFFDQPVIKKLRKIAGGDTYTCIYLKMMLMSVKTEGVLIYEGLEETLEKELALKLDEDETNIKVVISYLFSHHLMIEESKKNRSYLMSEVPKMTGKEGDSAERVRAHRERKNALALQCNDGVTENGEPIRALHCNMDVTESDENNPLLHCNVDVTACNVIVTACNDEVTAHSQNISNSSTSENIEYIGIQDKDALHCNGVVTGCNETETIDTRDKSSCISSSNFKETTTTTYIPSSFQNWLVEKSKGKDNPQGYEYTLTQKYLNGDENVIKEYKGWWERRILQTQRESLFEYRGKSILTQQGEKVILGIEQDQSGYKIYFEDGGFAVVSSLQSLSFCEKRSS